MTDPSESSSEADSEESIDFEAALTELEALVERMETGSLTLDESLKAFERGIKLTRLCQRALSEAELTIKTLLRDGSETDADVLEPEG